MVVAFSSCNMGHTNGIKKNKMIEVLENKGFRFVANNKGDFLLGVKHIKSSVEIPFERTIIKVYSVRDNRIIFEDEQREATAKWVDNDSFKVDFQLKVKSLLPEDNITEYIYNVHTGEQQTSGSERIEKI